MTALHSPRDQPLRKSAQRLRWFMGAFLKQVDCTSTETGNVFNVDKTALAEVFATWLKSFGAQKPVRIEDKPAYVGFAAGLMLRTLIQKQPVNLTSKPRNFDDTNPAYFWPEGYLYVAFCLNVRGLVLEHDFHGHQIPSEAKDDLRTWWSFRENAIQDPCLAIAFLDLFAGDEPEWCMPEIFRPKQQRDIAGSFLTPKIVH